MHATERHRIRDNQKVDLAQRDPDDRSAFGLDKEEARKRVDRLNDRLAELQEALFAEGRQRLLVVLQAMDAGGKDGTIRSVFEGVNPQGVRVCSFKKPTAPELARDFLWRVHMQVPAAGEIAIWNRSHYEDVLVVRVHGLVPEARWRARYQHIRAFEQMLVDEGTVIRKFFLHISKEEQRERLQERIDDPRKRWKFASRDLQERERWDDYMAAYEEMLGRTSSKDAPWYVVPADRNWYRNLVVAEVLVHTLEGMRIQLPPGEPGLQEIHID